MWLYCKQDGSRRKWSQSHQRNKTRLNCCGSGATSAKTETSTTLALPSRELHSSPATEGGELGGGGSPVGAGAGFSDVNLGGSPPPPVLGLQEFPSSSHCSEETAGRATADGAEAHTPLPVPTRSSLPSSHCRPGRNTERAVLLSCPLFSSWLRCKPNKDSLWAVSQPSVTGTGAKGRLGRRGCAFWRGCRTPADL